ncbi:MAG: hypothetical protein JWM10_588 [Myxococcaceae bacterium]|nr:hypothetical protein [Myxococcaceae bacterium]
MQAPLTQRRPPVQAAPHAPQLALSVAKLAHRPAQLVVPAGHAQAPATQRLPPPHERRHPPQLLESVAVLTQTPPQSD